MFILRCTFWLSVMYASISFGIGALHSPHAFESAVASEATTLGTAAVARATDWCVERPGRCIGDAAKLDTLVERVVSSAAAEDDVLAEGARTQKASATVPMPTPDPRRSRAVLTPML